MKDDVFAKLRKFNIGQKKIPYNMRHKGLLYFQFRY